MSRPGDVQGPTLGAQVRLARVYGLTVEEVDRALKWARVVKCASQKTAGDLFFGPERDRSQWDHARIPEPCDGRRHCKQCDQRVTASQAAGCASRFCKAKGLAFAVGSAAP